MIGSLGFLNAALLAGAFAATLPVLIHLLSKRRRKRVEWGAMFLLEQIVREDRRRIEIRQWLLLLLRALIILCLALLMARPILTGSRIPAGDAPTAAVLILDDSYSMAAAEGDDGSTRFERAVALGNGVRDALPSGSMLTVLSATSGDAIDFDQLDTLSPRPLVADLDAGLLTAADLLEASQGARRDVFVLSDFQSVPDVSDLRDTFVTLLPIALTPRPQNVTAVAFECLDKIVIQGRPIPLLATVQNVGEADMEDVRVRLRSDGRVRAERTITLRAGATARLPFTLPVADAQPLRLTLEVDHYQDQLAADNTLHLAILPSNAISILLVTGEAGKPFGENPGDFLAIALSPGESSVFEVTTISAEDVVSGALAGVDAIVMTDGATPPSAGVEAIWSFVRSGGGLMIFAGDRFKKEAWGSHPLPATLLQPLDAAASPELPPYPSPALAAWNQESDPSLAAVRFDRRWSLQLHPDATPLLQTASGDALIVERTVGEGRVALAAFPADGTWSDLPLRAAFLPLIQGLSFHVSRGGSSATSAIVGEAFTFSTLSSNAAARVVAPTGAAVGFSIESGRVVFTPREPGSYVLFDGDEPRHAIAANADRSESLQPATIRDALEETSGVAIAANADELQRAESERRVGQEVWRPLLVALLALLLGELLLGGCFGREVAA